MIFHLTALFTLIKVVLSQNSSPCPETFTYEPRGNENDRWYGSIALKTTDDLTGIWLHINLDRPAELLGNWFGDSTSTDNKDFVIRNSKYKLEAGPPVSVRFFVKYNPAKTVPSLKSIRLNGKTICPSQKNENELTSEKPTLHISQVKPTSSSNSNQNNGDSRPVSSRPSSNNNNNGGNKPSSNSRPGNRPSDNGNSVELEDVQLKYVEWQFKKQILELDLKRKQEEYRELIEERTRKRALFKLMEEEQKIKIEILKCQLNNKIKPKSET